MPTIVNRVLLSHAKLTLATRGCCRKLSHNETACVAKYNQGSELSATLECNKAQRNCAGSESRESSLLVAMNRVSARK